MNDYKLNYNNLKIQQTLRTSYGTTGQLYIVISPTGNRTDDHRAENLPLSYWTTTHTSHTKLTSHD